MNDEWLEDIYPPIEICRFPKHEGKLWEDIVEEDRPYVDWLLGVEGPNMEDGLYEYLTELMEETW